MNDNELKKAAEEVYPSSPHHHMGKGTNYSYEKIKQSRKDYIKGYQKAQEWISVEDRLPTIGVIVNVYGNRLNEHLEQIADVLHETVDEIRNKITVK